MRADQSRLWFASLAYVILNELRSVGLRGTRMASGYPDQELFHAVLINLQRAYHLKC